MGKLSSIQWTDHTWNPWHGCHKVSAGCKFCYMYRDKERYGQDATKVMRSKTNFNQPLHWSMPAKVFTCSWSDWFIEEADMWRHEAWKVIKETPHLQYQILSKRPERMLDCLPPDWGEEGYPNVWLGISIENQDAMDTRMPLFFDVPARVKFISCEPLLGPIQIPIDCNDGSTFFDWMIIGGESGNETGKYLYRPCELGWIKSLITQCTDAGCPVFVKQMGTYLAKQMCTSDRHGGNIDEWPTDVQIRQFPNIDAWSRKL